MRQTAGQVLLCVGLVVLASSALAKVVKPPVGQPFDPISHKSYHYATLTGHKIGVLHALELNVDCTVAGETEIKVVKLPSHGGVEVVHQDIHTNYVAPNPRIICNDRSLPGIAVYYTPLSGFVGQDHLEALVSYSNGTIEDIEIAIDVK